MQKTNRRTVLLCLLLITFCCWLPASVACGTGTMAAYLIARPTSPITDPREISSMMDRIEVQVQAITSLKPTHPVQRRMITHAELAARMKTELEKSYSLTQARNDARTYAVFGLLSEDVDLYQVYLHLYSTSIVGYYDPDTDSINVISDAGFGPEQMRTYAHEYLHALQFQRYGMNVLGYALETEKSDPERNLGSQAIIEGEASFLEDKWSEQNFSWIDQWDAFREDFETAIQADYSISTPAPLLRFLYFPYDQGKTFVQSAFQRGGWPAIDAVFRKPPISSEMILHPERYSQEDRPVALDKPRLDPSMESSGWAESEDSTWGEFGMRVMLELHLSKVETEKAATGWGGDRYVVWRNSNSDQSSGVWHTTWDTLQDADEFNSALMILNLHRGSIRADEPGVACWEHSGFAICQHQTGKDIWWVYAPAIAYARELLATNGQS